MPTQDRGEGEAKTASSPLPTSRRVYAAAIAAYATVIVLAEALITYAEGLGLGPWGILAGLGLHVGLLFLVLIHAALLAPRDKACSRFLAAFALLPLLRLLSLSTPLEPFDTIQWLLIISIPLLAGAGALAYVLRLRRDDVYLRVGSWRGMPVQVGVAASGLALGATEFLILRPDAWTTSLALAQLLPAAAVVGLATGLAEELIFRGLLLPKSESLLGRNAGLLLVSLLFAAMHIGFVQDPRSALDLPFVFGVGAYFGYVVQRTRNLTGVVFAHGLANVVLYLVLPFLA